jgi:hypothetical protein
MIPDRNHVEGKCRVRPDLTIEPPLGPEPIPTNVPDSADLVDIETEAHAVPHVLTGLAAKQRVRLEVAIRPRRGNHHPAPAASAIPQRWTVAAPWLTQRFPPGRYEEFPCERGQRPLLVYHAAKLL